MQHCTKQYSTIQCSLRPTSDLPHGNHKIGRSALALKPGLALILALGAEVKTIHGDVFPSGTIAGDLHRVVLSKTCIDQLIGAETADFRTIFSLELEALFPGPLGF